MNKNLVYEIIENMMYVSLDVLVEYRVQLVKFSKKVKEGLDIVHNVRIITYADFNKTRVKLVFLLTNDMTCLKGKSWNIYRNRWEIELLFKQLKQNLPMRYFY